ncbi:hypothetical protein OF83DRAFT_470993 [Amylostereum chailletii]|nr:hypothetical protein OF83DRAFT_470993 [Amylostereum chailletii]
MSDKFLIRSLTSADIPAVRALHASTLPNLSPLPSSFFTQLITHPTRICLLAFPFASPTVSPAPAPIASPTVSPAPAPIAFISASLQIPTSDLSPTRAPADAQITVLTLGVAPAYRRQHLATRLVHGAIQALRSQARSAPQVPTGHLLSSKPVSSSSGLGTSTRAQTRVHATMADGADGAERAFWTRGVGLVQGTVREPWMTEMVMVV